AVVAQQMAFRRHTIAPRHGASAEKEIDVSIAIEVTRRDAASVVVQLGDRVDVAREASMTVVEIEAASHRRSRDLELISRADDVEVRRPVPVGVEEDGVDVLGDAVGGDRRLLAGMERSIATPQEQLPRPPYAPAEEQI